MLKRISTLIVGLFQAPNPKILYGLIRITQDQMAELVKDQPVLVENADGGWKVTGLAQDIKVIYGTRFKFPSRSDIVVKRMINLETVLDEMDAGYGDAY